MISRHRLLPLRHGSGGNHEHAICRSCRRPVGRACGRHRTGRADHRPHRQPHPDSRAGEWALHHPSRREVGGWLRGGAGAGVLRGDDRPARPRRGRGAAELRVEDLARRSGSMAKNSASPIGMPSRMRLSAPTEGFIWLDSISEIVELVTPERLASSRCDSLWRARTKRSRPPISTLIGMSLLQVLRIEQILPRRSSKINGLSSDRKGLVAPSRTWVAGCYTASKGARP